MERSKCPVGRLKLQPHMPLQSLAKCIKQENNQEALKRYAHSMVCTTPLASHSDCSARA